MLVKNRDIPELLSRPRWILATLAQGSALNARVQVCFFVFVLFLLLLLLFSIFFIDLELEDFLTLEKSNIHCSAPSVFRTCSNYRLFYFIFVPCRLYLFLLCRRPSIHLDRHLARPCLAASPHSRRLLPTFRALEASASAGLVVHRGRAHCRRHTRGSSL